MEDKLVTLQKRAARAILDVDFTVPWETMFTQLQWMTWPNPVVYPKAIQIFKTVCDDAPDVLKNDFVFTFEIQSRLPIPFSIVSAVYTETQHRIIS